LYQKNGCRNTYYLLKTVATIPTSTQNGCHHTYIYSKRLPPYLHLLKTVATISTSTQNGCHHLYIYSKQVDVILAGQNNKRWERFLIHEIRRIDGRRGFQTGKKVLRIGGKTFYDQKNKILMKIMEFKRSGTRIIMEFRGISSSFPNQELCLVQNLSPRFLGCHHWWINDFSVNTPTSLLEVNGNGHHLRRLFPCMHSVFDHQYKIPPGLCRGYEVIKTILPITHKVRNL
jgi:hypothetical protein